MKGKRKKGREIILLIVATNVVVLWLSWGFDNTHSIEKRIFYLLKCLGGVTVSEQVPPCQSVMIAPNPSQGCVCWVDSECNDL